MANPFLVLGGIAVGLVTATFGVLQVPGWVASAQDASAKNDVAQVSIYESASLSKTGVAQASLTTAVDAQNQPVDLGVDVSTSASADDVDILVNSTNNKEYAVLVKSESGNSFLRVDGGKIIEIQKGATLDAASYATLKAAATEAPADGIIKATP